MKRGQEQRATIATVAKMAGVSTATVRRVLTNEGYVKTSTREAVEEAVARTAYRPNVFAKGLRTNQSSVLALVTESELNPFFMKVAQSVQTQALSAGYSVLMVNHNGYPDVERNGIERFLDQHVSAVIFCAASRAENVDAVVKAGVRAIQIEREVATSGHAILVDARPGMSAAISHLRELGHERIAYVGGAPFPGRSELPLEDTNEAQRVAAFRDYMADADLAVQDHYVGLGGYVDPASGTPADGAQLMAKMLEQKPRPTAVVVGSDFIAAGTLQAIYAEGLHIPDDISVIGYDDSMSAILSPPLTTIAQPMEELGRLALELALAAPEDFASMPRRQVLETSLTFRRSTSRPPD